MATNVAGATGGGLIAGATGGGDVMAQLQELAKTVEALAAALGGNSLLGTTIGGGDPTVVQQGDPTQSDPTQVNGAQGDPAQGDPAQGDPAQHGHGDPAQGDPAQGDPSQTGGVHGNGQGGGHDKAKGAGHAKHMQVIQRDAPVDRAQARKTLDATTEFFSKIKRSDVTFPKPDGTHGTLSDAMRRKFEKQFPGVEAPKAVVFPKGSDTASGVVYNSRVNGDFDLGMGTSHKHKADGVRMQHVWFTGDRLNLAFSDTTKRDKVKEVQAGGAASGAGAVDDADKSKSKDKDKDKSKAKGTNKA